jgi:hypothetical protein
VGSVGILTLQSEHTLGEKTAKMGIHKIRVLNENILASVGWEWEMVRVESG